MPVKTKLTQVKTSDGWFNVEYGRYYPGSKATWDDPGDAPDVDIIDVWFVDPEEDYENTIEGYKQMDSFMEELTEKVIEDIQSSYAYAEEAAAEARYEAKFDNVYF